MKTKYQQLYEEYDSKLRKIQEECIHTDKLIYTEWSTQYCDNLYNIKCYECQKFIGRLEYNKFRCMSNCAKTKTIDAKHQESKIYPGKCELCGQKLDEYIINDLHL